MRLDFISKDGSVLPLWANPYCWLTNVDGMTNAANSLATINVGGMDGDFVNNIHANPRTIIMDLRIKDTMNVEDAKRQILSIIKLKQKCALLWTQNGRTIQIKGIVESINMPRFNNSVTMQVTLHCSEPFWEDIEDVLAEIDEFIDMHYFTTLPDDMLYFPEDGIPFGEYDKIRQRTIFNDGDVAVGMDITIVALTTVTNPLIYNQEGNFFGIGYNQTAPINKIVTMQQGDYIEISTHRGNKTVKLNGTSIIDKVKPQSTWLQLQAGENIFTITSDDEENENMTFYITYKRRYV